jgi:hypothetical protein
VVVRPLVSVDLKRMQCLPGSHAACAADTLNLCKRKALHLPNIRRDIMRVLQTKEIKAVSGAGLLTSVVVDGAKGLFYVGKGVVNATGSVLRFLI